MSNPEERYKQFEGRGEFIKRPNLEGVEVWYGPIGKAPSSSFSVDENGKLVKVPGESFLHYKPVSEDESRMLDEGVLELEELKKEAGE